MTPLLTVSLLFWSMLAFAAAALAFDKRLRRVFGSSWKAIALIVIATALWRTPWDGVFFHGLEYEDSYVYTVVGRQMAEHVDSSARNSEPPFSFSVCAVGSIGDCRIWEPFPEHLIGYPYVISLACRALGYSPAIGSLTNFLASLISAVLVFMLAFILTDDSFVATLSGLIFAALPVFAVYGLETSAEPFSCCCMLLVIWLFMSLWRAESTSISAKGLRWCAYTCALLFCQTIKREDAVLALALPLAIPFVLPRRGGAFLRNRMAVGLVLISSLLAIVLSFKMHLLDTSENERELLRQFPLTLARMGGFIAGFLSSFVVLRWYGGSFLAVLAGCIVALRRKDSPLLPSALLVAFIVLYASHIRGYYEMESGRVSPESALRFSMNLMGLWAILAGIGLAWATRWLQSLHLLRLRQRSLRYSVAAAGAMLLLGSFFTTLQLRRDAVEDETNSRITPALVAAAAASLHSSRPAFILTMHPLVVQMYAGRESRIVDLESFDMPTLESLLDSNVKLLLLKQNDRFMEADLRRYGEPIRRVVDLPWRRLDAGDGFTVSVIEPPSSSKY